MIVSARAFAVPDRTEIVGAFGTQLITKRDETLAIVDVATGRRTAERIVQGLTQANLHSSSILLYRGREAAVLRGDLGGDLRSWPDAETFHYVGAEGEIAIVTNHRERRRIDLARGAILDRSTRYARLDGVYGGLAIGREEREVVAIRVSDGKVAWTTRPFAGALDDLHTPRGFGDEVHVRASRPRESLVARIRLVDGAVIRARTCQGELEAWLPDVDEATERTALGLYRRSTQAYRDGLLVPQDDQLIVVRADGLARVALPPLRGLTVVGDAIAGIVEGPHHTSLVVVPIPDRGEHDLEIVPTGDEIPAPTGVPATVTFVGSSAAIVIAQHPELGRINLRGGSDAERPAVGARVILEGVSVRPGGVVDVRRWWIDGARTQRDTQRLPLNPAEPVHADGAIARTSAADALATRAAKWNVPLPRDLTLLLELLDADPALRHALETLGFFFDEHAYGNEVAYEHDLDFLAVWGDGHGDGWGGLLPDGSVAYWYHDEREPSPLPPVSAHVRARALESDSEASAQLVLDVLERAGL